MIDDSVFFNICIFYILQIVVCQVYVNGFVKFGKICDRVIVLDGDIKNFIFFFNYRKEFFGWYIECFVVEQNMIGVVMGCVVCDCVIIFFSIFVVFFICIFDYL